MVNYDRQHGKELMQKYLNTDKLQKRLEHTEGVADFAFKVASRIKSANPELVNFNPEFVGFLGFVHDIGYSVADGKHEVHTINILVDKENIPQDIARFAMHGQLAEQFGQKEEDVSQYLPHGLEGMVLTYADMSVRTGEPITLRERAKEIIDRVKAIPTMPEQLKKDIEDNLYSALPRFEKYESTVFNLANVLSVGELVRPNNSFMYRHFKIVDIPEDFIEQSLKKSYSAINIDVELRYKGMNASGFLDDYDANIIFSAKDKQKTFTMQKMELTLSPSSEELNILMSPIVESAKRYARLAIQNGLQVTLNNKEFNPQIECEINYTINK